jgi:hypothetical protein
MKLLKMLLSLSSIKNGDLPVCKDCKYLIPCPIDEKNFITAKCQKIGEKNILSGEINNYYIDVCRKVPTLCGQNGKYFVPKDNSFIPKAN